MASSPTARSRNRRLALAEGSFPDHQSRTRTGPRVRPRVRRVRVHHPCCFTRRVPNGRSRAVDEYMMPLNPLAAPQLAPRSARLSERKRARCTRRCRAKARPSLRPTGLHGSSPFRSLRAVQRTATRNVTNAKGFVTFVFGLTACSAGWMNLYWGLRWINPRIAGGAVSDGFLL